MKKILWCIGVGIGLCVCVGFGLYTWLMSFALEDEARVELRSSKASQLPYLQQLDAVKNKGRVLAVLTSAETIPATGGSTGYDVMELARVYWVMEANGFTVTLASPEGGKPNAVVDDEDMGPYDFAFLNHAPALALMEETVKLGEVDLSSYDALIFIGGKGAMVDFPYDSSVKNAVKEFYTQGKVVAAICHGPAALLNVQLDDGGWLVEGRTVNSFTNSEELLLNADALQHFNFLLESALAEQGADFRSGADYLNYSVADGQLVTAQNPWSSWAFAERVVSALGHRPVARSLTPQERSVQLIDLYHRKGYQEAKTTIANLPEGVDARLVLMHGLVSAIQGKLSSAVQLGMLAEQLK